MLHFLTRKEQTDRKNSCSNPPAPTKNSSVVMTLEFLFYLDFITHYKGG
nr:MAG TPA: hypothetical protein [Caudoviricetes sp.]